MTTRFVIVCAARTGSTMLRYMLDSHSAICCHGEAMNPSGFFGLNGLDRTKASNLGPYLFAQKQADPVRFLNEMIFRPDVFSAVGVKIKYNDFLAPLLQPVLDYLCRDRQVRIIHLTRKNRLRRYVSLMQIANTRVVVLREGESMPRHAPLNLTLDQCVAAIQAVEAEEIRFRHLFAHHAVCEVTYEDIVSGTSGAIERVQHLLGVRPEVLNTPTLKMGEADLREVIADYPALQAAASSTPYADLFD